MLQNKAASRELVVGDPVKEKIVIPYIFQLNVCGDEEWSSNVEKEADFGRNSQAIQKV